MEKSIPSHTRLEPKPTLTLNGEAFKNVNKPEFSNSQRKLDFLKSANQPLRSGGAPPIVEQSPISKEETVQNAQNKTF